MDRRKDNLVPFRPRPRKQWTRAEDFMPPPPRLSRRRDWRGVAWRAGVWLAIAALVAATAAASVWL